MKVTFEVTFTIRELSSAECEQHKKPEGTWEVLDQGFRLLWASNKEEAVRGARSWIASDLNVTDTTITEE